MTRPIPSPATLKHKIRITIFAIMLLTLGLTIKGCDSQDEPPLFIINTR